MIVEQLLEFKEAGVWKDFSNVDELKFAPRTLIYGFNGSGKTTLSRIFSSLEKGVLEERLPKETTFKIKASGDTTVTQDLISNPFGNNLLVFNTDFVSRNFKWSESSTAGIVYLSETNIEARNEYDEINSKLPNAKEKITEKTKAKKTADQNLKEFKTRTARTIREMAASSGYTQSYDARKIEERYRATFFRENKELTEDELKKHLKTISQSDPLPKISFNPSLPENLVDWFKSSQSLVKQGVSRIAMDEFESHSSELRWVEHGLQYHDEHRLSDCLLCGNHFSDDRRDQLRSLFDKSWTEALGTLENAVKQGQNHHQNLRQFYSSIPKDVEINATEREVFSNTRTAIRASLEQFGVCVGKLLKNLKEKAANPTKEIVITKQLSNFNLDQWFAEYAAIEEQLTKIITNHNDAVERFEEIKKSAFNTIEAHVLATNQSEWNELQKAVNDAEEQQKIAQDEERKLSNHKRELRNALEDHGVGADKMNELIFSYLGHKGIRLVAEDGGGYGIRRANGDSAVELSEGERTAISFCYFLAQLDAEGRKRKNLLLVIDDPVSSLDTTARTYAYSLITRMTKNCAQLIILTHNTNFMSMVKRNFQNLKSRNENETIMALLLLDCKSTDDGTNRVTSLAPMPELLTRYDSEYHYLFSIVLKAAETQKTDYMFLLPNATRKLLEMFSSFCSPGQPNFAAALGECSNSVKNIDVKALESLVQIESHGTMAGLDSLPDLTLEESIKAADAAIKFIKEVGGEHYKKMKRLVKNSNIK